MVSNTQAKVQADRYARSHEAHQRACKLMPGGVSSPVRAFQAVGRDPITVVSGEAARIKDIDGNEYVDYVMSYGPLILGHAHETVLAALSKASCRGTSFGMSTEAESQLAELIISALPSVERIRFVNSGTEACMSAIRLARAATGRNKIIKCTGCYHGHFDGLLVEAGSGALTLGVPSSPGVPAQTTAQTLLIPYNDLDAVEKTLKEHGDDVAVLAVEPIAGNMGCVPPKDGYLSGLRKLCDAHGVLLLFDEVMTGFRVAWGGAQVLYGVQPDLTCLGKVVGGGLPCAAYGGRADLMQQIAPEGPVYQAGTLSGNPLAMAAGLATLQTLHDQRDTLYPQMDAHTQSLDQGLKQLATKANVPVQITRVGSMLCVFFLPDGVQAIENYEQAKQCRTDRFTAFFGAMLDHDVMLAPSQYEAWFVSTVHDEQTRKQTLDAAAIAFQAAGDVA